MLREQNNIIDACSLKINEKTLEIQSMKVALANFERDAELLRESLLFRTREVEGLKRIISQNEDLEAELKRINAANDELETQRAALERKMEEEEDVMRQQQAAQLDSAISQVGVENRQHLQKDQFDIRGAVNTVGSLLSAQTGVDFDLGKVGRLIESKVDEVKDNVQLLDMIKSVFVAEMENQKLHDDVPDPVAVLRSEIMLKDEIITKQNADLQQVSSELEARNVKVGKLEKSLEEMNLQSKFMESKFMTDMTSLQKDLEEYRQKLEASLEVEKKHVDREEKAIVGLKNEMNLLQQDDKNNDSKIQEIQKILTKAENDLQQHRKQIETLEKENALLLQKQGGCKCTIS